MIEQTLHGLVVGLGKIRKDGSKEFHWLDKPIHNRIVSGGLDYLLTFNGSNSAVKYCPKWEGSYTGYVTYYNRWRRRVANESTKDNYSGCLQFMAIGTGEHVSPVLDIIANCDGIPIGICAVCM